MPASATEIPPDPYGVLGITREELQVLSPADADAKVKGARRTLAWRYHPDYADYEACPNADEWYDAVEKAYALLESEDLRREFESGGTMDGTVPRRKATRTGTDPDRARAFGKSGWPVPRVHLPQKLKGKVRARGMFYVEIFKPANWQLSEIDWVVLRLGLVLEVAVGLVWWRMPVLPGEFFHAAWTVAGWLVQIPIKVWLVGVVLYVVALFVPKTADSATFTALGPFYFVFIHVKAGYILYKWFRRCLKRLTALFAP